MNKGLIRVCPCDLNEVENTSASWTFYKKPAAVHLSISPIFSLLVIKCGSQLSADCCAVFLYIRRCYH